MLPISVIVPTRNSRALLNGHLHTMFPWIDLVSEIIVVDSESSDGTWDILRASLPATKTKFLQHKPGLYQSWNYGIQQARAPFLYVSTVGDQITREGLLHLLETANSFSADVVVSPPAFVNEQEQPVRSNPWPVHRLISYFELDRPVCWEGLVPFACAVSFIPFAILGSAASNLYRTRVLQENPFPTDYGGNGDGAWGVFNSLKIRFGITPRCISTFKHHPRPYRVEDMSGDPEERMFARGMKVWNAVRAARPDLAIEGERLGLAQLIETKRRSQWWRTRLLRERSRLWPWIFNPVAWYARSHRDTEQRRCNALLNVILRTVVLPEGESIFIPTEAVSP